MEKDVMKKYHRNRTPNKTRQKKQKMKITNVTRESKARPGAPGEGAYTAPLRHPSCTTLTATAN